MKKKQSRKLTLHRETLRKLQGDDLRKVIGRAQAEPTDIDCTEGCTLSCGYTECCTFGFGTCDTCGYDACGIC